MSSLADTNVVHDRDLRDYVDQLGLREAFRRRRLPGTREELEHVQREQQRGPQRKATVCIGAQRNW